MKFVVTENITTVLLDRIAHTTYVDAVYCYQPSSMVYWSVCLSVGLPVTLVSYAKMPEPIEMLVGLRTRVGPADHVLDGGPDPTSLCTTFGHLLGWYTMYTFAGALAP